MAQLLPAIYPVFTLTVAGLFLFGLIYAWIVRRLSDSGVQGQTAYTVVVGVGVTVLASAFLVGWANALLVLVCFAASGLPMIIEYGQRTHKQQKDDRERAAGVARDLLK